MDASTIRPLATADLPAVAALLERLARKFITPGFPQEAEADFLRKNDAAAIGVFVRDGHTYWVAESQGQIVGFAGMRGHSHLYHLFVAEEMQQRGVGRKLWNTARQASLECGNPGRFTVNASDNAVRVYEAFGFVRAGLPRDSNGVVYNPMVLVVDG